MGRSHGLLAREASTVRACGAMRREAALDDPRLDEARLLAEAGFLSDARAAAAALRAERPDDLNALALEAWVDHRRGAISAALDTWRTLHEAAPNGSGAIARIAQLRAEESATLPRADLPLVRRALRFVAAGNHERALVACAEGGAAARAAGDAEQRKLLAIVEALVHELAGRPAAAAAVLTQLGEDPAYAQDVDRLAILARVCEQAGDRQGLQAAERVLGFMASSGILSAYPRLVQIRHSLGDAEGMSAVERSWEEAFRKRIHRLTPEERAAAATRRYVPLDRLRRLVLPPADRVDDVHARAVAALAHGAVEPALATPGLPPAWRAEALLACGDLRGAAHAAAEALRARADLPHALLAARCLGGGVDGDVLQAAREVLAAANRVGPADPELLRAQADMAAALGDEGEAAQLRTRAEAAERRRWPPAGTVRAAAVYSMPGRQTGLVHEIIVRPVRAPARERGRLVESEIHGALARGVRAQLRRIFAAVRESLAARFPDRAAGFDGAGWSIHFTKEDEPSGGPSLGLPAAIAFASALLDAPVPRALVFTGAISYDAAALLAVRPVGELGAKLEAALHVGASALLFPAAQAEEALSGQQVVPASFAREVARPVATFDEALAIALGG